MTPHFIELIIVAIILITLYVLSKRVDDNLEFVKNELNKYLLKPSQRDFQFNNSWVENNGKKTFKKKVSAEEMIDTLHIQYNDIETFGVKEPSFKSKLSGETKRMNKVVKK